MASTKLKSRASSSKSSHCIEPSFGFRERTAFDGARDLLLSRSENYMQSIRAQEKQFGLQKEFSVWNIPPIDFRLQLYQPKPKFGSLTAVGSNKYNEHEMRRRFRREQMEKIQFVKIPLPRILQPPRDNVKQFETFYRSDDYYQANSKFVREGKFDPGFYENPRVHDFRPLECPTKDGKPRFDSTYEKDPFNIKAHTEATCKTKDPYESTVTLPKIDRSLMKTAPERAQKWDRNLILKKEGYKRGRSPKTALMRRIERKLGWTPADQIEEIVRPDINDYKTVDWLHVTSHSSDETTFI